jgi:hypothetical protein
LLLSSRHSKVRFGPGVELSLPRKPNVAVVSVLGSVGASKIVVFGGVESGPGGAATTVQV